MDPTEYKAFTEQTQGQFAGIGATLKLHEIPNNASNTTGDDKHDIICPVCGTDLSKIKAFQVVIVKPLPGSPAEKAGIHAGDVILKVNEFDTDGQTLDAVVEKIRGPIDTKVTLTVAREGLAKPLPITIMRGIVDVPATEHKIIDNNIGYLRLDEFNDRTFAETRDALHSFNAAHIRGLVLDLRGNPGGLLAVCQKVTSLFLPAKDTVIVSTKGRDRVSEDITRDGDQLYTGPMVVLVDKGSASASEILTGALMDYHRAKSYGVTTFGKGLVQTVLNLGDEDHPCAMPVTTARYYTPSGYNLDKRGITPNVPVVLDKNVKETSENDNQAQTALQGLKGLITAGK
jgi:carboxyl-terminal processing protease